MSGHVRDLARNQLRHPSSGWVLLFCLLGFGLRVQQLDFQPLWGDEGWSFYFSMQPLSQLLALTAVDIHPPLYYILLKGWLTLTGPGAEVARFFSIIAGTALIPTLYGLGRRLFDEHVGLNGAAVVTFMPLAIYYAQEVRMYGLVTLLGAMSVYFFVRLQPASPTGGPIAGQAQDLPLRTAYVLTTTAALYTHYFAALILLFQLLYAGFALFVRGQKRKQLGGRPAGPWQDGQAPAWPLRRAIERTRHDYFSTRTIYRAAAPFLYVGLLSLPWVIYVMPRLASYVGNKRDVEGYLPLNFFGFFGDHFVAFSIGHLSSDWQPYAWLVLPYIIVASVGFLAALSYVNERREGQAAHTAGTRSRAPNSPEGIQPGIAAKPKAYVQLYLYLFVPLLAGYFINQIFPFNPTYFERTLLLAAPAYWLFLAVGLTWLWRRHHLLLGTAALALLAITGLSLLHFFTVPRYPHEDYRPLLKYIAARAAPEDTILASYEWQLGFYQAYLPEPHPNLFAVPGWGASWAGSTGRPQLVHDLTGIFGRSPRLWFPAHQSLGHMWEDQAEAAIADLGYPALLAWYSPQTKLTLAGSLQSPLINGPAANFEDRLQLLQAQVGNGKFEAGRGIVPIGLIWQKIRSLGSEHRVSLRLADNSGRTWATRDSDPQAGHTFFTDLAVGETLADRHGLLIPAGTPPGTYRLFLSVRQVDDAHPLDLRDANGQPVGAELLLTEIEVIDPILPVDPAALPVQFASAANFGREARLAGYSIGPGPFKAGQPLPLNLFWQSLANELDQLTVAVQLQDETGQPLVAYQQAPIRPTITWDQATLLRDPHEILLPPTLPSGDYRLVLQLLRRDQSPLTVNGATQLALTTVTTIERPHNFEAPAPQIELTVNFGGMARLVGIDLPATRVKAGEPLTLTLYWQGLAPSDKNWKVFVHLVDESGRIISQQDQVPGGGQYPTTSWLPNEYIADPYRLPIPADVVEGEQVYELRIGLYDANDFSRLPVTRADRIVGDHFVLDHWRISVDSGESTFRQ